MRTNTKSVSHNRTHEGAPSPLLGPLKELRRTVMACMLWEDSFYENGVTAAERIARLVPLVSFEEASAVAMDAREKFKLRHVPLLVVREMLRKHHGGAMGRLITQVIQRPDELGELLSLYWKDRDGQKRRLPMQLKIGLARALKKFNSYQLAKYNRDGDIKLRDVMFLVRPRANDPIQAEVFKQLAENTLPTPDTWETQLSAGADKKETFTRLLSEHKLGALALLRNLRNMIEAGVSEDLIREGLTQMSTERVLPFRFLSAARHAPRLEDALEQAMFRCLGDIEKLPGKTALLIDHSGSMDGAKVSQKSEIDRFDAACALGMMLREICERVRIFSFSTTCVEVPPRRGFALKHAVKDSMPSGGTALGQAVKHVYAQFPECERLIVITDEQSADRPPHPQGRGYVVNVGTYQNGIAYGPWVAINGWSEAIIEFIRQHESQE